MERGKKLEALKEILSAKTVEEAVKLRKKYAELPLTSDEIEVINRHWSHLKTQECMNKAKGDIQAYLQCSINDIQMEKKSKERMPRINPHASALKQDEQLRKQIKWLKEHGFKTARDAQEAGY